MILRALYCHECNCRFPLLGDATVLSSYSGGSVTDRALRPHGILVAHLQEH